MQLLHFLILRTVPLTADIYLLLLQSEGLVPVVVLCLVATHRVVDLGLVGFLLSFRYLQYLGCFRTESSVKQKNMKTTFRLKFNLTKAMQLSSVHTVNRLNKLGFKILIKFLFYNNIIKKRLPKCRLATPLRYGPQCGRSNAM